MWPRRTSTRASSKSGKFTFYAMQSADANSCGPERDLLCRGPVACLLWCVPWFVFALGFWASPTLKMVLWTASLAFMGAVCLVNASRCGRIHSLFTGPFFILGAIASLGFRLGLLAARPIRLELDWRDHNCWGHRAYLYSWVGSRPLSGEIGKTRPSRCSQLFILTRNETLPVPARVNNPDCSAFKIQGWDPAQAESGFM